MFRFRFCCRGICITVVLSQAALGGRWLVVEGLDAAPPEVLAALAPLLEGRRLHLAHRAQTVPVAAEFQFLATVTTLPGKGWGLLDGWGETTALTRCGTLYTFSCALKLLMTDAFAALAYFRKGCRLAHVHMFD